MTPLGLHLVVQLYGQPQSKAHERMLECIQKNSELEFVKRITVVCEGKRTEFRDKKIKAIASNRRASYADLLKAAQSYSSEEVTHFAVANTDIFLTEDILCVMRKITKTSSLAAISRTETNGQLIAEPKVSQDLWIFKAHQIIPRVLAQCEYLLGIAGCEHLFAMSLYSHGYDIWNPCLNCQVIHNDPNPKNQWADRYHGSYLFIPPCDTNDIGSTQPKYEVSLMRRGFEQNPCPISLPHLHKDTPIKLHLCCGDKKLPGFLGVDIREEVDPDIVASVDDLNMIDDGLAEEIYFCHGFEHIPVASAEMCLHELRRVLKPGGCLRLALPDFEALSRLYVAGFARMEEIRPAIHGGQDYVHNTHYASWDIKSLATLLQRCGFSNTTRYKAKDFLPRDYFDWSLHSLSGIETSLNVICFKQ